jgi:hypothetical protein
MKGKKGAVFFALITSCFASSLCAQVDGRFNAVDNLLDTLQNMQDDKLDVQDANPLVSLSKTEGAIKISDIKKEAIPIPVKDPVYDTRFMDVTTYTRFIFKRDIVIPANKSGVLFSSGKAIYTAEDGISVPSILSSQIDDDTCFLESDKSHLIMKGKQESVEDFTYLDVKSVSLIQLNTKVGDRKMASEIIFSPKGAKNDTSNASIDSQVNITLWCTLPVELYQSPSKYTLGHINSIVGDLFEIKLPNFIEI